MQDWLQSGWMEQDICNIANASMIWWCIVRPLSMRFYLPRRSTAFWISFINTLHELQAFEMSSVMGCYIAGGYMRTNTRSRRSCDIPHATEIVAKQCPRPGETKPYFPRAMNISVQKGLIANLSSFDGYFTITLPEVAAGHCDLQNVGIRSG